MCITIIQVIQQYFQAGILQLYFTPKELLKSGIAIISNLYSSCSSSWLLVPSPHHGPCQRHLVHLDVSSGSTRTQEQLNLNHLLHPLLHPIIPLTTTQRLLLLLLLLSLHKRKWRFFKKQTTYSNRKRSWIQSHPSASNAACSSMILMHMSLFKIEEFMQHVFFATVVTIT